MSINSDKRIGKLVPEYIRREDAAGVRYDSGPYVGKVKNNLDPTRSGRLQVWIADLASGNEDDPGNWRTVAYASPFFGTTAQESRDTENSFSRTRHSYGMWFTPPDVDNFVLCVFVAGDPMRGFWFACVPNQLGHYMTPALASSDKIDKNKIEDSTLKKIVGSEPLPVVEWNENNTSFDWSNFTENLKPLHEIQSKILVEQGLDRKSLTNSRGSITSSSQRETPSGVFGVSTPGRATKTVSSTATDQERKIKTRRGGHSFVMDDGDASGKNNLVRLRSAGGHQILMDDSEGIVYVINSQGSAYIEMTDSGHINVYSSQGINMRTEGDFNLHSDKDINLNADGAINLGSKKPSKATSDGGFNLVSSGKITLFGNSVGIGSEGKLDLSTAGSGSFTATNALLFTGKPVGLNSGAGPIVNKPPPAQVNQHDDTEKDSNGQWQIKKKVIKSIAKIVPAHEPWLRTSGVVNSALSNGQGVAGSGGTNILSRSVTETPGFAGVTTGANNGLEAATNNQVSRGAPRNLMNRADSPNPPDGIGTLSQNEVKALMTQIAFSESSFDYTAVNSGGYLGKYQFGAAALVDNGYIHKAAYQQYGQAALNYPSSWTGKDGVNSKDQFLSTPSAQENAMYNNLQRNYNTLKQFGGIRANDDPGTVSGMLMTSHLLGAGGAKTWRETGVGSDANNTTGATYFNRGKYANQVLAATTSGPVGG